MLQRTLPSRSYSEFAMNCAVHTEVGAWRVDRTDVPFHSRRNPQAGEPTPIGGFYTQEDIKEIVGLESVGGAFINIYSELGLGTSQSSWSSWF